MELICVMGNWLGLGKLRNKRGNTSPLLSPAFSIRTLDVIHLTCGFLVFSSLRSFLSWLIPYQALKSQTSFNKNFSFSRHAQYSSLTPCKSYYRVAELNNLPPSEMKACSVGLLRIRRKECLFISIPTSIVYRLSLEKIVKCIFWRLYAYSKCKAVFLNDRPSYTTHV